ncbi:unnamed protein product, partial [Brenthis ino]
MKIVIWKKPMLFFEDLEFRYGLWKHFQSAKAKRTKKVVIHVPYKVKKIKHTHTVFKTVHHHHTHHDHQDLESLSPAEEHEHFHYMHLDEPPVAKHSHLIPGIGIPGAGLPTISIPEFLPDAPVDLHLDIPDVPRDRTIKPKRIPLFRRD